MIERTVYGFFKLITCPALNRLRQYPGLAKVVAGVPGVLDQRLQLNAFYLILTQYYKLSTPEAKPFLAG